MSTASPLIALISAVDSAIPSAAEGFADAFPEATLWNILDDRLIVDALAAGGVDEGLADRMASLVSHAIGGGADGVLLTCSMYSPVAARVSTSSTVPVLSSDGAAFSAAATGGYSRIALVSSLETPLADARSRFDDYLKELSAHRMQTVDDLVIDDVLVTDALAPSKRGDRIGISAAVADAIAGLPSLPDAVLLAQYSLAPAADEIAQRLNLPVLAGPARAAATMRAEIFGGES